MDKSAQSFILYLISFHLIFSIWMDIFMNHRMTISVNSNNSLTCENARISHIPVNGNNNLTCENTRVSHIPVNGNNNLTCENTRISHIPVNGNNNLTWGYLLPYFFYHEHQNDNPLQIISWQKAWHFHQKNVQPISIVFTSINLQYGRYMTSRVSIIPIFLQDSDHGIMKV